MESYSDRFFSTHFRPQGFIGFAPFLRGFLYSGCFGLRSSRVASTSFTISGGKISFNTCLSDFRFGFRFFIGEWPCPR